jgi:hypothetical protein
MSYLEEQRTRGLMAILGALFVIQHPVHEDYEYIRECIEKLPSELSYWSEVRWMSICDALRRRSDIPNEIFEDAEWQLESTHQLRRASSNYHGED